MKDDDIRTLKDAIDEAVAEAKRGRSFVEMYQQMVASREASVARLMGARLPDGGSYVIASSGGYTTHTVTYDPAREEMKRYMGFAISSSGAVSAAPAPLARVARHVKVSAMSNGVHPEVGMRVKHEGTTFEIERIEIETPSWRVVAIGHAVGDRDTFSVSRLRLRVPVDELEPADIETKENAA